MSIEAAFAALEADGAELALKGGRLHARPAGRITPATLHLVRGHASELRQRLAHPLDLSAEHAITLALGHWVLCESCAHFTARPARLPDGLCDMHGETWARVPLPCGDYLAELNREATGEREKKG